jgi:hypothetical protein
MTALNHHGLSTTDALRDTYRPYELGFKRGCDLRPYELPLR